MEINYDRLFFLADQGDHFASNLVKHIVISDNKYFFSSLDLYKKKPIDFWNKTYRLNGIRIFKLITLIMSMLKYKTVVILYVNPFWIILLPFIFRKRLILVFYGSEFYNTNFFGRISLSILSKFASNIVFTSYKMKHDMAKIISDVDSSVIKFGNDVIININELMKNHTKDDLKREFEIDLNKITITIGYNGSPFQNHISIIDALGGLDDNIKNKIHLLLPLNYANIDSYEIELISALVQSKITYSTFFGFLDSTSISKIRFVSDIYVNNMQSDNISASVLEYLFAGNLALITDRISYDEFVEYGFNYTKFHSHDEFAIIIKNIILKWKNIPKTNFNINLDLESLSWSRCAENWIVLLDGLGKTE